MKKERGDSMINCNNVYLTKNELEHLCDHIVDEIWENCGDVDSEELKSLYMILCKLLNNESINKKKYLSDLETFTLYE